MARNHRALLPLGALLLLLGACASPRPANTDHTARVPKSIGRGTDSLDAALLDRSTFFTDPQLRALIDTALARNLDLLLAGQRVELARAGLQRATGQLLPELSVHTTGSMRKFGLYTMDGAGNIVTEITPGRIIPIDLPDLHLGVQAAWEVDVWGRLRNMRKAAARRFLATREARHAITTQLVAEVANTYYELVALDRELGILEKTLAQQTSALEAIEEQKRAGRANELGVQQFTAQIGHTRALERDTRQRITEAENLMNFLLGRYPQPVKRDTAALLDFGQSVLGGVAPAQLVQLRPDILQAEQEVLAARADLKAARAAFYPGLTLGGGYGVQAFDPALLFSTPSSLAYTAIGGLVAPLLNRNQLRAGLQAANAERTAALLNYQRTVLNAVMEVNNGLARIENLNAAAAHRSTQTQALRAAAVTADELYRSAKATYLDVLLAQQGALAAEIELVETQKRQRIANVDLYRAMGGGWR